MTLEKLPLVGWAETVSIGEKAVAYGFPLRGALSTGGNFTIGNVSALTGLGDDTRYIQISTPVQPGNSGGPLLDSRGNLIGVVSAKLNAIKVAKATGDLPENVNFAVRAQVAKVFLSANNLMPATVRSDAVKSDTDLASIARNVSVHIECHP